MLSNIQEKIKYFVEDNKSDLLVAVAVFLVGLGGFGLGRLSAIWSEKKPITIIQNQEENTEALRPTLDRQNIASVVSAIQNKHGKYIASKSGTAYHFPWCAGAQKIKEANKIWFNTKEEAESRGYKPAGNCEGL